MPLDHDLILSAAVQRLRGKGAYSDLPARFLQSASTLAELHEVYEIALGQRLNVDAFRRKVMERDFLEETGEKRRMPGANLAINSLSSQGRPFRVQTEDLTSIQGRDVTEDG